MNLKANAIVALIGIGILISVFAWNKYNSVEQQRQQLVADFIGMLPSSLEDHHRDEIKRLFDRFWYRADQDKVEQADVDVIVANLHSFVKKKTITVSELDYMMAEGGYFTFRADPRLNLPDGEVDHPVLNPSSATVNLQPDSAFWSEFEEWKKTQPDSVVNPED